MNRSHIANRSSGAGNAAPRGFTLIELMIVVAIIALLATVALPSYLDHVRKTRRADAIARISQIQQAQERFRANNAQYAADLTGAAPAGLGIPSSVSGGYYSLSITGSPTATSYTILAAATGAQLSDTNCKFLSLTMSAGNTTLASGANNPPTDSGAVANRCWNR